MLFKGISQEDINKIFLDVFYKIKTYDSDKIIAFQEEYVENLLILISGTVRGEMIDFSGKTIVIEEIESPRPLAPAFLFGINNTFPVNIVSQTNVEIIQIPKSEFVKMMQKNNILLTNFMNNISERAQFLSQKLKFLSFHSIKGKFAYYILNISKKTNSKSIVLPLSQDKLADLFGITRPSLSRAIRELNNDCLINSKGKDIEIINIIELNKFIK